MPIKIPYSISNGQEQSFTSIGIIREGVGQMNYGFPIKNQPNTNNTQTKLWFVMLCLKAEVEQALNNKA